MDSMDEFKKELNELLRRDAIIRLPEDNPMKLTDLIVMLSGDAAELLVKLATKQRITQSEALRRAIATEVYIKEQIESGATILIQKADDIRELFFR